MRVLGIPGSACGHGIWSFLVSDIFGVDRRPALAKLNRPTLVIGSSASPLLDAQKDMAALISEAKLVIVEEAGNALFIDQPERFDEAFGAFLRSVFP